MVAHSADQGVCKNEDNDSMPKVTATISIDSLRHSFANLQAPTLNLTLTSHHKSPITIYADDMSPFLMLSYGAFVITDLANGLEVFKTRRNRCKLEPPSKVIVPLHEDLYHTLYPNTPLTLPTPFTRSRSSTGGKPWPKSHLKYGDTSLIITRPGKDLTACSVDRLEASHNYALSMADNVRANFSRSIRWWEFGTKEIIVYGDDGTSKLDGRKIHWRHGPHPAIKLDLSEFNGLIFHCTA